MVTYFPNTWLVKKHHTVDLCAAFFTIVGCWSTIWAVNDVHCLLATKTTFPCWWAHFLYPSPEHWRLYCFPSFTFFSLPGYISPYIYFSKWNYQNINKSVILTICFSSCLSLILCCLSKCGNYLPEQLKLLADPIVPLWQLSLVSWELNISAPTLQFQFLFSLPCT